MIVPSTSETAAIGTNETNVSSDSSPSCLGLKSQSSSIVALTHPSGKSPFHSLTPQPPRLPARRSARQSPPSPSEVGRGSTRQSRRVPVDHQASEHHHP